MRCDRSFKHHKSCYLKRNLRDWNSQIKIKSLDWEINERDNNRYVNLITIETIKVRNNNEQI